MYCHVCGTANPDSASTCYSCKAMLATSAQKKVRVSGMSGKRMTTKDLLSSVAVFHDLMLSKKQTFDRVLIIEEELKQLKDTGNSYDPIGSNRLSQKDADRVFSSAGGTISWIFKWWNALFKGAGCYTIIAILLAIGFVDGLLMPIFLLLDGKSPTDALAASSLNLILIVPALLLWHFSRKSKNKLSKLELEKRELLDELWGFYDTKTDKAIPFEYSHPASLRALYNIAAENSFTTLKDALNEFERRKRLNMIYQHDAATRDAVISSGVILGAYVVSRLTSSIVVTR